MKVKLLWYEDVDPYYHGDTEKEIKKSIKEKYPITRKGKNG